MPATVRPTKKQRELLTYIERFITEHGYSPSYREIMAGLNYTSIATVALHVNNLVKRGHLQKRDNSARSLEVINGGHTAKLPTNRVAAAEEKWLVEKVEHFMTQAELAGAPDESALQQLTTLVDALKVLGLEAAAHSFLPRLSALKGSGAPH